MGMFDTIDLMRRCPKCKGFVQEFQTKDLDCAMYTFTPYRKRKKTDILDRSKIGVFKRFPFDKSARVWKSQDEEMRCSAMINKQFYKLKYIDAYTSCSKKHWIDIKIPIEKGMLIDKE